MKGREAIWCASRGLCADELFGPVVCVRCFRVVGAAMTYCGGKQFDVGEVQ